MAARPSDKSLRSDIGEILKDADLTTLSSKKIRKQLEEKYGIDLTDRKAVIDKMIMEMLSLEQDRQASHSKSTSVSSSKDAAGNKTVNGGDDSESQEAESDDDDDVCNASPVRKKPKIQKQSKGKSLEDDMDDKEENSELDDEDIARQLQEEEHKAVRKTRGAARPASEKKKTSRSKKEPGSSRKTNKYTEPCYLSPQLAAIMGESRLKRSDVVKKMWAIVKERNLYDPRDKRYMICDAEMQSVFGCKKVQIFGMMKYLKHHITSPDDVA